LQVDAIVCTAAVHLKLGIGELPQAVLQAAGADIQTELFEIASKGPVNPGDVLVTRGYRLKCRHVLHAICCQFKETDAAVRTIKFV
jgi:O-acetyl-ADP-ribose deacetylase (regulator of RNase III)